MGQKDRVTWREAILLHKRGFQLYSKQCPKAFLSLGMFAVIKALSPYLSIYLSALLVNELAGRRDISRIVFLTTVTILSTFGIGLLTEGIKHWKEYENVLRWQAKDKIFINKMMEMDFADIDKAKTHELYAQIEQNQQMGGWGLAVIPKYFETGLSAVLSVLGAIFLTVGMFLKKVEDPKWAIVNHPIFIVIIVAAMFGTTALSAFLSTKSNEYYSNFAKEGRFGNNIFSFFGRAVTDKRRAIDMRMYNQQDICKYYFTTYNVFGIGAKMSKMAWGICGILNALSSAVSFIFQCFIYIFVCLKAWAGAFGVGSVTQYIGAVTALFLAVENLLQIMGYMKNNTKFLKTVFEFLDIPNQMYQGSLTIEKRSDYKYEIEFRNVSFCYPGSGIWALKNVNLVFQIGERLAIVGENGSGKTTFIKLLCRLYDPQEGQILLNGIDIRKYNYKEYISIFSVVFQDFQLLSASLGENIAAGAYYNKEMAEKCLRNAGFEERLKQMPNGLATNIYKEFDQKGVEISGGEAQKIALARALYKDAPFIILDEPTAALDPVAEQEVYEKFNEITGDKTAIYISHRLSSCKFCDKIAVFHKGSIVEYGSHQELVRNKESKYYQLWSAQAQYYTN